MISYVYGSPYYMLSRWYGYHILVPGNTSYKRLALHPGQRQATHEIETYC